MAGSDKYDSNLYCNACEVGFRSIPVNHHQSIIHHQWISGSRPNGIDFRISLQL